MIKNTYGHNIWLTVTSTRKFELHILAPSPLDKIKKLQNFAILNVVYIGLITNRRAFLTKFGRICEVRNKQFQAATI